MNEAIGDPLASHLPAWHRVGTLSELLGRGRMLCRVGGRQIVVFATPDGVRACNNRCPHEGYPLTEGKLNDCVLTCNWHNWKFDLRSGENLFGGDRLRIYPVSVREDEIWLDLGDPPHQQRRQATLLNLRAAFDDNGYDRMGRELARLQRLGCSEAEVLRELVAWSWDRFEFGWTHAFGGMADWLCLYDEFATDDELRLACLLEIAAHIADDVLREERYPYPEARQAWDEDGFVVAIEAEDQHTAVAMIRGALRAGFAFASIEKGLTRAALQHYNDFGHSLIYVAKLDRLTRRLGNDAAEPLLLSLVRGMGFATREDLIPEFRAYASTLSAWGGGTASTTVPSLQSWRGRGIESSLEQAVICSAASPLDIYLSLLGANANNLLAFDDTRQERPHVSVAETVGWLDFTHGITFANAVRVQCGKFPDLWPQGLLQMACFHGRNARFSKSEPDMESWRVAAPAEFLRHSIDRLFVHGIGESIVSVHMLKTLMAVREELELGVPDDIAGILLAGLNRFLHSSVKRRNPRRTAYQSRSFVAHE